MEYLLCDYLRGSDLGGIAIALPAVCSWKLFDLRKKVSRHSLFCKSDHVVNCDDDANGIIMTTALDPL